MPSFKDTNGREWLVTIDTAQIMHVRKELSINLADLQEGNLLVRLGDPVTLVDVLFVLVRPQADERDVTLERFAAGISGDSWDAAEAALLEALRDFFREPYRTLLRKMLAAIAAKREQAMRLLERDGDQLILQALERTTNFETLKSANPTGA